jgi:hypothetical protein
LKCIALGVVFDKGSYLRDSWSILDMFIVFTSIIDVSVTSIELPFFKVLRMLRTLRPLRFISHSSDLKMIVSALISSIGAILNVVIILMVVYMMFAILAINLFAGKFQYCTLGMGYENAS